MIGLIDLTDVEPSQELADELFPPNLLGPTWRAGEDGSPALPEYTLGWECLAWCAQYVVDDEEGQPWQFTPEQARFVLWLYEIDPETGQFTYPVGILQRLKGWGKDPLAAALALFELVGPCRFSHFDPSMPGGCVGRENRSAWVQIIAVSKDQTKNTMFLLPNMIPDWTRQEFNLDIQKEIIQVRGYAGRRIEAVTSSFRAAEGNRPTFVIANETHHWTPSRGGKELWRTLYNNVYKSKNGNSRILCLTNAYMPGEGSVAEALRQQENEVLEGVAAFSGVLYDSLEANAEAPLTPEWAPYILRRIRGDATWLNVDLITSALQTTSVAGASQLRRFWYNQIVAAEDALYNESEWDGAAVRSARLEAGDEIVMGFDGGKSDDASALVAIRIRDKVAFPLAIWQRPDGSDDWEINPAVVDSKVRQAMSTYKVRAFFSDVHPWENFVWRWGEDFRDILVVKAEAKRTVGYDMRGNIKETTHANEALMESIRQGDIKHNGDLLLRRHALNARARYNNWGMSFGKEEEESPNKVDAYAALLLAFVALNRYNESGKVVVDNPFKGMFNQF